MNPHDPKPVPKIEMVNVLDLRPYSRRPDVCLTEVLVQTGWSSEMTLWIQAGEASIRINDHNQTADLKVYWDGVQDAEHDSAYILVLPLIGVKMTLLHCHTVSLIAWIDPNEYEGFNVPLPGYPSPNDTRKCLRNDCKGDRAHLIGPYIPKVNTELFTLMRGRRVEINIGPPRETL